MDCSPCFRMGIGWTSSGLFSSCYSAIVLGRTVPAILVQGCGRLGNCWLTVRPYCDGGRRRLEQMPMQVLLQALALAGPALQPVADQAVKDGYSALKTLIVTRFGTKNPKLARTLDDHAE